MTTAQRPLKSLKPKRKLITNSFRAVSFFIKFHQEGGQTYRPQHWTKGRYGPGLPHSGVKLYYDRWKFSANYLYKTLMQLSQTDRAAGCNSFGQKWKTGTGRQYFTAYRSIFNHCDVICQQSYRIRWKTQNKGYYAVQGHSRPKLTQPAARYLCDSWATCFLVCCSMSLQSIVPTMNVAIYRIIYAVVCCRNSGLPIQLDTLFDWNYEEIRGLWRRLTSAISLILFLCITQARQPFLAAGSNLLNPRANTAQRYLHAKYSLRK